MSTTTHIHGPYQFEVHRAVRDGVYAQLDILDKAGNRVHLYFTSREQADALIAAAIDTEHVFAEAAPAALVPCAVPEAHFPHGQCPGIAPPKPDADFCPATIPSEHPGGHFSCTKNAGHEGDHFANGARCRGEEPLTWPQECGALWSRGPAYGGPAEVQRCTLASGHAGNHIDPAGHAWGGCTPGQCTCGATVSSAGVVTPAATA